MLPFSPPSAHHAFDIKNALEEGTQIPTAGYSSRLEKDDLLRGEPNYNDDGSGPLFSAYIKTAGEEDRMMADGLKADADRVFIFSGLFSAVVSAFLTVSVRDLRPDPQNKPTFYLENIYQLLADPNRTDAPIPPALSNPPTFSPPKLAVWVNSLWFLSLCMTLSCALLAILLQRWVCQYIKVTQQHSTSSPHKQARMRAFFDKGIEELHFQFAVDVLPILLHASLALFLAGLVVFSFDSNHTVFKVVVSWVGLCALIYACFTLIPVFRHESPYHTPLSSLLWRIYTGTVYIVVRILQWFTAFRYFSDETWVRFSHLKDRYRRRLLHGIEEAAEESAQKLSSEIDSCVLLWMLRSSDEDHKLERFFASIPDFCSSKVLEDPLATFKGPNGEKMADAVIGLIDRTLSSDLLPQSTKQRRIMICSRAMTEASLPINRRTLERVLYNDWGGLLDSVEFGLLLMNSHYSDPFAEYYSQCVVSVIIARVQEHDDLWFKLVTGQLGMSKPTIQNYLAHGDSMLLANCIFICRRTMEGHSEYGWHRDVYSRSKTLELVSRFDVQDTLPGLQREFCVMWNELVRNAGNRRSRNPSIHILKHIRNIYCGLHQGTSAAPTAFSSTTSDRDIILLFPRSYPSCQIARHHSVPSLSADIGTFPAKVLPLGDKHSGLHDHPLAAVPAYTPQIIPVDSENHHLLPVLPFRETFGVMQGDACTHATSFGLNITPRSTYAAAPRPPSYLLSNIRDHRTERTSDTSDATAASAWAPDTPSAPSPIVLRRGAIMETTPPLATHGASLIPATNADHADIASADMQSDDNVIAASQQCILVAPPARAVLRMSPVNGDCRSDGPLVDRTHGTGITSASSAAGPISGASCTVSTSPQSPTASELSVRGFAVPRADATIRAETI